MFCFIRVLTIISLSLLFSCSKYKKLRTGGSVNPIPVKSNDNVTIKSKLDIKDKSKLTSDEAALLERVEQTGIASFNKISDLLIISQLNDYKDDIYNFLNILLKDTPYNDLYDFKVSYEKNRLIYAGKESVYYKKTNNLVHTMDNKDQCYSATVLNQILIRRKLGSKDFISFNLVIIYEEGHILTGQMFEQEGVWYLQGIENTILGDDKKEYGKVSELDKGHTLRIIDANEWAYIEIYKKYLKRNSVRKLIVEVVKKTAGKYGIPFDKLENKIKEIRSNKSVEDINSSPFAFGDSSEITDEELKKGNNLTDSIVSEIY